MRTTVTVDEDVLRELRKIMREDETSFKQALNDTLRRGVGARRGAAKRGRGKFRVKPHRSAFVAGIDPGKLNQLADQLETERFSAAMTPEASSGPA